MPVRTFGSVWRKKKPGGGSHPGYYVSFPLPAGPGKTQRFKKYGGDTRAAARLLLSRIETLVAERKTSAEILHSVFGDLVEDQRTFAQLAQAYMARPPRPNADPETTLTENRRIQSICRAPWAGELLADLKPRDIQLWLDERQERSSSATANRDRAKASAIFKWGIPRGFANDNPVRATTRFPEPESEKVFWLTETEAIALLEVATPRLRTFIVIALATALRRGAILRLCWKHFDFDLGYINPPRGRGTKSTPPRLEMTPALRLEVLAHRDRCERTEGEDHLFADAIDTIRDDLRRARRACTRIVPERRKKIGFHALRHTAASWMVQDGVPIYEVARILGHGSVYVTQRYAHLVPGFAAKGMASLAARLRPEDLPTANGTVLIVEGRTADPAPPALTGRTPGAHPALTAGAEAGADCSPSSTPVLEGGPRLGPRKGVDEKGEPS